MALNRDKTHCKRGHPLVGPDADVRVTPDGKRQCRKCIRIVRAERAAGVKSARLKWADVLERARDIVAEYDTQVTLRQLFYRLVAEQVLPNTQSYYGALGRYTADARRRDEFPDLVDTTREIHRLRGFDDPEDALEYIVSVYRLRRDADQEWSVYIGVEKRALARLLEDWFEDYGVSILVLGGYASQSFVDQVRRDTIRQGRPAVLIYAGDYDPSGRDIFRDFEERTSCWDAVAHVALTQDQIDDHDLPSVPAKSGDSRARDGDIQVELDALPPDVLHRIYQDAFQDYFDMAKYDAIEEREDADRHRLASLEL